VNCQRFIEADQALTDWRFQGYDVCVQKIRVVIQAGTLFFDFSSPELAAG
jgi:hypothetical protein